jgi:ADP-ribosyl-[dinitrogen reductase] hydrolase
MNRLDPSHDRILGALVGLAIGDALGAPTENMTAAEIVARFPRGNACDPPFEPGEITDDTEMARLVARSLVARQRLDMEDIARRLVRLAEDSPSRLGPSTSRGIAALRRGVPWWQAGAVSEPSSGALPRCAPLGLVLPEARIVSATVACCLPTHRHPLAIAAASAQNLLLCRLVAGATWSDASASLDSGSYDLEGAETIRTALAAGTGPPGAVAVLAEAVACVAQAPSAAAALIAAVSLGGDTDTRGAAVGVLAGSRWGANSLPQSWESGCSVSTEMRSLAGALALLRDVLSRGGAREAGDEAYKEPIVDRWP